MTLSLQRFATGDTNYIGKHNSNADALEAAIATVDAILAGITGVGALSITTAYEALFGATVAVIGAGSYACSGASTTLTVQAGYCWRPTLQQVLHKASSTTISFSGLSAATYYIQVDSIGTPLRTGDSTEAVYSVVWDGAAFGTITRLANIAWGEEDWLAAQVSTALAASYTTLDARLEAGETKAVLGAALAQTTRSANQIFAGPTSGGAAAPSFRAAVVADLPFAGSANGVATLDGSGKVPTAQLPAAVLGGLAYQGTWNASTNSPSITTGSANSGNKGYYYKVNVAGTTTVDGISLWSIGDWIVSNGTTWDKVDNTEEVFGASGSGHSAGAVPDPGAVAGSTKFLREDSTWATVSGATGGTVTSVDLSMPAEFAVAGNPVTSSGTLAVTKANQSAHAVFAGPSSGGAAAPAFRALVQADLPTQPYDVGGFYPGVPTASVVGLLYKFPRQVIFPSGLTDSTGVALTAATATTDFDIQKNGSSVGTVRFAAAATSATFIMASQTTFSAGDVLKVIAPGTPDATLANISIALAGTR